jgi:hypothetical protein
MPKEHTLTEKLILNRQSDVFCEKKSWRDVQNPTTEVSLEDARSVIRNYWAAWQS